MKRIAKDGVKAQPAQGGSTENLFRKLPMLPPSFSFRGLEFFETPKFPRELYRGAGVENLALPESDNEKNMKYFMIKDGSGQAVGAIGMNAAKRLATYLFIFPEARGKGYGTSVLEAIEDCARKNNWPDIKSHVPSYRSGTLDVLERLGWAKSGPYPSSTPGKEYYIVKKEFGEKE